MFEHCYTFNGFITYFHIVILSCIVIMKHNINLVSLPITF